MSGLGGFPKTIIQSFAERHDMDFQPLYYQDRLKVINPFGNVGLVTLWSKVDSVCDVLGRAGVDFDPATSSVAVAANLYGNGLPQMVRNLLYNPQITTLIIVGKNLSGSREWLTSFFKEGLEEVEFLGNTAHQIRGTNRVIDGAVRPEHFVHRPEIVDFGDNISDERTQIGIREFLENFSTPITSIPERQDPPTIPEPEVMRFPSNPFTHSFSRPTPLEAWRELVFRLYRFGHRNNVAKSTGTEERIELRNVHIVVEYPMEEPEDALREAGFSLEHFHDYQRRILDPVKPADIGYTYGWLLRTGMEDEPVDSLEIIVERLKKDPESRHAYATLWNNRRHLPSGKGCPCFVTAFFRRFEGKLTLDATFRAHNALDAWLENFYGLMAIQRFVAEAVGMEPGCISVISHSISLDPAGAEKAKQISGAKKNDWVLNPVTRKLGLPLDPNGEFTVTFDTDTWELVAQHSLNGVPLGEYRGRNSEQVERHIARDCAVSLISHALYLGRELARKEQAMKEAKAQAS